MGHYHSTVSFLHFLNQLKSVKPDFIRVFIMDMNEISDDINMDAASENSDTATASEIGMSMSESESDSETSSEKKISFVVLKYAFKSRIKEYVLKNILHIDPKKFLDDAFMLFELETQKLLHAHKFLKIHTSLKLSFVKQKIEDDGIGLINWIHERRTIDTFFQYKIHNYYNNNQFEKCVFNRNC